MIRYIKQLIYRIKSWILLIWIHKDQKVSDNSDLFFDKIMRDPEFAKFILDNWGNFEIASEAAWQYLNIEHPYLKDKLEDIVTSNTHA